MAEVTSSPWDDPVEVTVSPVNLSMTSDVGVLDTGATHHVFNDRTQFSTYRSTAQIPVKMADGSKGGVITGVGTVVVESMDGSGGRLTLRKVDLCETLRHNLISGINLYNDGINFATNETGLFFISKEGGRVNARRESRKWILRVCDTAVAALVSESYKLWHERFGHPNERVLRQMVSAASCNGLPERLGAAQPCEICADAKSTKTSSLSSTLRTYDEPLQMVVADLCGPFQEKVLGGPATSYRYKTFSRRM